MSGGEIAGICGGLVSLLGIFGAGERWLITTVLKEAHETIKSKNHEIEEYRTGQKLLAARVQELEIENAVLKQKLSGS